jgi:hypothetical protein
MDSTVLGKKHTHINRNKLNELKESLSSEDMQIFNIISKNIFPKTIPKTDIFVQNIISLNEKIQKKKRFSFKVTSDIKNNLILKYLEVFPTSFQEEFKKNYISLLD